MSLKFFELNIIGILFGVGAVSFGWLLNRIGYDKGYKDGYKDGYAKGYDKGFKDGYEERMNDFFKYDVKELQNNEVKMDTVGRSKN